MIVVQIILSVGALIGGGYVGLRRLLFATLAFLGGFSAYASVKAFYFPLGGWFAQFMRQENAAVITLVLLIFIPLLAIFWLGRRLMVKLAWTDNVPPMIDATLGAGYSLTLFLILAYLFIGG